MRPSIRSRHAVRPGVVAAAAWLMLSPPASAVVVVSGSAGVYPQPLAIGPGDTDLGGNTLGLGNGGVGDLLVDGGSLLSAASIRFGDAGNGVATGLIDGVGSRVNLTGDGNTNRLELGAWGRGMLTVSGGAALDGRASSADCLLGARWCHNFIGNAAGSEAQLTITGAGSQASFLRAFVVGGLAVFRPPIENFTFGTPGGTTRGSVSVLAGGTLVTDQATLGAAPGGSSPLGSERSFAEMTVSGAGSLWHITGGTAEVSAAFVSTGTHRNAWATLAITDGGTVRFDGPTGLNSGINLSTNGGRSDVLVSGPGSQLLIYGDAGVLQVGRRLGSAQMTVNNGGLARGMFYLSVGRDGAVGDLLIDGAGSLVHVNGTATAAANGNSAPAFVDIGRSGNGTVTVSGGGKLLVEANQAFTNGTGLQLGRDAASSGTLNISGAGSVVQLKSTSVLPGGGPGETANPFVRVGRDGNGVLSISGGGKLLLDGGAVSTSTDRRSTNIYVGGNSDTTVGGKGVATVTGAGSEIRLSGGDTFVGVGIGPQSSGQLNVLSGGNVAAHGINVGRSGGVGVLRVDNATLNFSGQQTAGNLAGGFLVVGSGGGIGVASIDHGSVVTLNNMGSSGASLSLGGTGGSATPFPGGDGSLTLAGGSRIQIVAAPGLASVNVAREGSALLRVRGGSSIDAGDGNITIARFSGSDGTVLVSEGSTITAGWLGVGARRTVVDNVSGDTDGGTGTFVLVNSTLNAGQIVIGTNGFLGGTGTINGVITNRGIFAPGNSPGRLEINGGFVAEAGSRLILEVEADGSGGFRTDQLVFNAGQPLDLDGLNVEFRFLGNTDPVAFRQSGGFGTDTFFQVKAGDGSTGVLAPSFFSEVTYEASAERYTISNFSFDAVNGANSFSAAPVPEPATNALLLAGLLSLGWLARRRRRAAG